MYSFIRALGTPNPLCLIGVLIGFVCGVLFSNDISLPLTFEEKGLVGLGLLMIVAWIHDRLLNSGDPRKG